MKYLNWIKNNINFISVITGLGFIIAGKSEVGQMLINQGASL